MKTIYVTFQIRPTAYCKSLGCKTKHFAIECHDDAQALKAAADVNSLDGISYIRYNKCLRSRHKDIIVISFCSDYEKEIWSHL